MNKPPVALITGAAKRIGAKIASTLHQEGFNTIIHYNRSKDEATALSDQLNHQRADSAITLQADLNDMQDIDRLVQAATSQWQGIDVLVNNASSFFPTGILDINEDNWDRLINSNLKAALFLSSRLANDLARNKGCIINISDIYAEKPLTEHIIYCIAKAGNNMMTKSLSRELAPDVRVNAIAPGAILWPEEQNPGFTDTENILKNIPLQKIGSPSDIANVVRFLATEGEYITGQILAVDGGFGQVT